MSGKGMHNLNFVLIHVRLALELHLCVYIVSLADHAHGRSFIAPPLYSPVKYTLRFKQLCEKNKLVYDKLCK